MNREKANDALAIGIFLLWVSGVCELLLGIWLPSWQWALTGILSIAIGTVCTLAADE
jgi:hypothetical protein